MSTAEQVRGLALELPGAEERKTWGRPTFRVADALFAALHDDLLILRGTPETQAGRLAADPRLSVAPYWGRFGWVAIQLADVTDRELPQLLDAGYGLAAPAKRPEPRSRRSIRRQELPGSVFVT